MKKIISIIILTVGMTAIAMAQDSSHAQVEQTLFNYINGSAYNKLEQLGNAFADDATLYLTIKDVFKPITPKEYIDFFKGKPGEFNGRAGKVLSIEVIDDIALAKAEILIPERKWRFVDLFLLKNIDGNWKIISKTATKQQL